MIVVKANITKNLMSESIKLCIVLIRIQPFLAFKITWYPHLLDASKVVFF